MQDLLNGKCAFITGGNRGIGKAIAIAFASAGARVAICATNEERGKAVVDEINTLIGDSDRALFVKADVSNTQQVEEAIKTVQEKFSFIDILVNNAGITRDQLLLRMKEEDWDQVMDINVKSCYNSSRAVLRQMMKARKGKIINVSSAVGLIGNPGQTNYVASKAAVIGFTKALAKEAAPRGINVNCIAPGFIETPMTDALNDKQREQILSQIPLERMGKAEEIAKVALFLASELSDYMTGQVISVDGGMVM